MPKYFDHFVVVFLVLERIHCQKKNVYSVEP